MGSIADVSDQRDGVFNHFRVLLKALVGRQAWSFAQNVAAGGAQGRPFCSGMQRAIQPLVSFVHFFDVVLDVGGFAGEAVLERRVAVQPGTGHAAVQLEIFQQRQQRSVILQSANFLPAEFGAKRIDRRSHLVGHDGKRNHEQGSHQRQLLPNFQVFHWLPSEVRTFNIMIIT